MKSPGKRRALAVFAPLVLAALSLPQTAIAQAAKVEAKPPSKVAAGTGLLNETPATFVPVTDSFDYVRRDVMIPMRDGVKLHTVILVPKGAKGAPILLTRTPYDAKKLTSHAQSAHLGPILQGYDNATDVIVEGGYIRVVQDVRGKYGSEGDYVMNRPLRGPLEPDAGRPRDRHLRHDRLAREERPGVERPGRDPRHLLRRLPAADGARQPAPGAQGGGADEPDGRRLDGRRLVPQRRVPPAGPAVHLRPGGDARRTTSSGGRATTTTTTCSWRPARRGSSGGATGSSRSASGARSSSTRPTTPSGGTRRWTASSPTQPLKVPVMLVHSLWDQEDIYGAIAVYKALEPKDTAGRQGLPRPGPWHHGQEIGDGSSLGALRFGSDTALTFRREILRPVPRPVPEGRRAEGRRGAGHGVRDRDERLAAPAGVAGGLRERLHGEADAALSRRRPDGRASRRRSPARRGVRGVRLGPRQAGAVPRAPDPGRSATTRPTRGRGGSWTTSARRRAARTSSPSSPTSSRHP